MIARLLTLLVVAVGFATALGAEAPAPMAIEIFTDSTAFRPVGAGRFPVHDLSAPRRMETELGRSLPASPEAAAALARSRIATSQNALRAAFAGHAKAAEYGITKVPAVVFDRGAAVVYGTADAGAAFALYRRWREGRP